MLELSIVAILAVGLGVFAFLSGASMTPRQFLRSIETNAQRERRWARERRRWATIDGKLTRVKHEKCWRT